MKWLKKGFLILGYKKYTETVRYDVLDSGDRIILKYSQDNSWMNPGKPAHSLLDTGDFLVYFCHHSGKRIMLDYDQAESLRALLKLNDRANNTTFTHYEQK